jgi:anti-sigma-K factor RskA
MSDGVHVFDLLPAYALGCLDQADARRVSEHLAVCSVCRTELSHYELITEELALAVPEQEPPSNLQQQLTNRIRSLPPGTRARPRIPQRQPGQRLVAVWGLVSLLLIVGLVAISLFLWQQLAQRELFDKPGSMRAIALHSSEAASKATGFIIISGDGSRGTLIVDQMPSLASEQEYQFWLVRNGQSTSGARFTVDEKGYRGARIMAPESLFAYSSVLITIEPVGGSPQPTGRHVMDASLPTP